MRPPRRLAPNRNVKEPKRYRDQNAANSARRSVGNGRASPRPSDPRDVGQWQVVNFRRYESWYSTSRRGWIFRGIAGPEFRRAARKPSQASSGTPIASRWTCNIQRFCFSDHPASVPPRRIEPPNPPRCSCWRSAPWDFFMSAASSDPGG